MIGLVVATHGEFGASLLSTLRTILGESEGVVSVPLDPQDSLESFQTKLEKAIRDVDPQGSGTLVMVDMLGGTPFNVSIRLATEKKVKVLTGVNLPMLLKALSHREEADLDRLCAEIQDAARQGIVTSVDLLKKQGA